MNKDAATLTVLKGLADETRLSIVRHLSVQTEPAPSSALISSCSAALNLSQPTMSHHFKKLVDAGIISEHKQKTTKFYTLNTSKLYESGIDVSRL